MPTEVTVSNLPAAAIWIVALSQFLLALGVIIVLALFGSQIVAILKEIRAMVEDMRKDAMPEVKATLRNVKSISDDAARTTHNVTTTADNVTGLVNNVVNRVESPLVKVAGLFAGVMAGAKAARGKDEKSKKGGKRGR